MNRYRSRVDIWIAAVLWFAMAGSVVGSIIILLSGILGAWFMALFLVFVGSCLPAWIYWGTYYEFVDQSLIIQSGPSRWVIPIASIQTVRPSRNPISSPALSLHRIEIGYSPKKTVLISPVNEETFLKELQERIRNLPSLSNPKGVDNQGT